MVAMLAETMLVSLGAGRVITAHSLPDGLAMLEEVPDAAMLDINLRGEQSFPIAKILTERATPFIYATAYGNAVAAEGPSAPVVTKPYGEAALRAAFAEVLGA